jgi:hypothetical protein
MSMALHEHFDPELLSLSSTLERVPYTSHAQIEEHIRGSRPAVFTGAFEHWPAREKWNPEYFRERWGAQTLAAHETAWNDKLPYESLQSEHAAQKTVAEFIENVAQLKEYALYAHEIDAAQVFPGSQADLCYSTLIDSLRVGPRFEPHVWMGTPGTRSGLHFDGVENLISLFFGGKAFMLVDPTSPRRLYPSRDNPTKSRIDPMKVDWKAFHRLRQARIYIDVLQPGEMLLLPHNWWHYLTSVRFTINATCWFFCRGIDYPESRSLFRAYLSYTLRCGPSYPVQFLYQFLWNGMLKQPYKQKALSPPPVGAVVWQQLRGAR